MIRRRAAPREIDPHDWTHQPARPIAAAGLCILLACAIPGAIARSAPGTGPSVPAPDMRLDVNTANHAELMALPGIGRALATAILDYRAAHGPFASLDALDAVRGIGPRTIEDLRPLVVAEPPPTAR
jgi:competence ComEA-like helix-hairpin-helix protein